MYSADTFTFARLAMIVQPSPACTGYFDEPKAPAEAELDGAAAVVVAGSSGKHTERMCAVSQGRGGTRNSCGGGWFAGAAAWCAARAGGDWRGAHLLAREAKPETITRVVLDDHEAAAAASDMHDGRKDRIARRARKHGPGDSCGEHASSHPPGMRRLVPRAAARDERHLALVNLGTDHDIVTFNALQIWGQRYLGSNQSG